MRRIPHFGSESYARPTSGALFQDDSVVAVAVAVAVAVDFAISQVEYASAAYGRLRASARAHFSGKLPIGRQPHPNNERLFRAERVSSVESRPVVQSE
ncbi:hypothetical protein ebA5553 [Aromatoleum aromaticum EbN1]|uniref:Uncharacterized protein n=1 Tax=Aromatoleum aromaticum (strain DSM 19018 / LMG 30748 / EbN1) TaxID=76114 RepID=Q5P077_AROAE|nr:hypothetical protein ebA5553 [Aromatoleum aromaticum EbN1]